MDPMGNYFSSFLFLVMLGTRKCQFSISPIATKDLPDAAPPSDRPDAPSEKGTAGDVEMAAADVASEPADGKGPPAPNRSEHRNQIWWLINICSNITLYRYI